MLPHGVIVGPDGAPWITDGGLNAIVRVNPETEEVRAFPLPENGVNANLNTATFDHKGVLWFTGQGGIYGHLDPASGKMEIFKASRGVEPYGISTTPEGSFTLPRSPAGILLVSILTLVTLLFCNRKHRTKEHNGCGLNIKSSLVQQMECRKIGYV